MDRAFQRGLQHYCNTSSNINSYADAYPLSEIYIPWKKFTSDGCHDLWDNVQGSNQEAEYIASQLHPAWHHCSQGVRKLHTRNVCQILGKDLKTPSSFVIFSAPEHNGVVSGGTATAIRLARENNIPCYNLQAMSTEDIIQAINQ